MKKPLLFILFINLAFTAFSQITYVVNTTDDLPDININDAICADANGNCTLRAAIQNANKSNDKNTINFNISGTAPFTIVIETSELPAIGYPIVIDGRTQPEYPIANTPVIEIDGSGLPINNSGLKLYGYSDNSEIYGLSIGGFQMLDVYPFSGGFGIDVNSQNNVFKGNYIGLKPDGSTINRNFWGIYFSGSGNNTFGGVEANEGNVVSGNYSGGVTFDQVASSNNTVLGNLLGTDATGLLPRGNRFNLQLLNAPNNTIGGNTPEARNILSGGENNYNAGTDGTGISIKGANATNNTIIGNYIGTDITGNAALTNMRGGILLLFGANNNNIGGEGTGEGNIISGNGQSGIFLQGDETNPVYSNSFKGNYIGVDATGNSALPNGTGISLIFGVNTNNIFGGTTANSKNIISGNTNSGITIGSGNNNQIIGNYIGTNVSGTSAIPNNYGVFLSGGNNTVGGQIAGSRNIISGNSTGIYISGSTSSGSSVKGNYIGLNASGNGALPNTTGIVLTESSVNSMIGGADPIERNIISGNNNYGIQVFGTSHTISYNYIGLNASGTAAVPNTMGIVLSSTSSNCIVGGQEPANRNIISGNSDMGIYAIGGTSNTIQFNYVGLNPEGDGVIQNGNEGMRFNGTSTDFQVSKNTISGNGTVLGLSVNVNFAAASNVHFFSNNIGTLPDGNTGVLNIGAGLILNNSSNNIIGGDSEDEGNIIGNHDLNAVSVVFSSNNNTFSNNKIGVGADGNDNIGNVYVGINITGTNTGNTISNNILANNQKGVELTANLGIPTQVTISENSIYNNSIIGIDLVGTTENDADDADTGVNNLQNTPEISAIIDLGDDALEVTYAVPSSITNSAYPMVVEFFGAVNGQGKIFIESDTYAAPGNQTVTLNLPTGFDVNDYINIVATATDANGNTSEFGVSVDSTLSISQLENQTLKIYPNPVSERLLIQFPNSEPYNLKLVNTLGEVVLTRNNNSSSGELDVSALSSGLYFLNVTFESRSSQTLKFIKN